MWLHSHIHIYTDIHTCTPMCVSTIHSLLPSMRSGQTITRTMGNFSVSIKGVWTFLLSLSPSSQVLFLAIKSFPISFYLASFAINSITHGPMLLFTWKILISQLPCLKNTHTLLNTVKGQSLDEHTCLAIKDLINVMARPPRSNDAAPQSPE